MLDRGEGEDAGRLEVRGDGVGQGDGRGAIRPEDERGLHSPLAVRPCVCVRSPAKVFSALRKPMRIESQAFYENQEITDVEVPMGVTEIGDWAYACCHKLQHVTLPVTITNLGDGAFSCCPNLRTVVAPGVTSLGEGVFAFDENLERVEMPRVQRLPPATFRYCGNLRT